MDNSIVSVNPILYHPEYDFNTNEYFDFWPEPPRRTCVKYLCYCSGGGKVFSSKTEYSYHINLKSHRNYIYKYSERIESIDTAKDYIKKIVIKYNKVEIENARLKNENAELKRRLCSKESETNLMSELD